LAIISYHSQAVFVMEFDSDDTGMSAGGYSDGDPDIGEYQMIGPGRMVDDPEDGPSK